MAFGRKHALSLLFLIYIVVLYGMYRALLVLGPLKELRWVGDPMEHGYKIFFFSMQFGVLTYVAYFVVFAASILYLWKREMKYDDIASASAKITIVFTTIVLINGAIFSDLAWRLPESEASAYWVWDPRQTTTLILWFVLAGYLALRSELEQEEHRARLSSILAILGFAVIPLALITAAVYAERTLHPAPFTLGSGRAFQLDPAGRMTFGIMIFGGLLFYAQLLWVTLKIEKLEKLRREGATRS